MCYFSWNFPACTKISQTEPIWLLHNVVCAEIFMGQNLLFLSQTQGEVCALLGKQKLSTELSWSSWITNACGSLSDSLAHDHLACAPKRSPILVLIKISMDQEHPRASNSLCHSSVLTDNTLFGIYFLHSTLYENQSLPNHGNELTEKKTICRDMLGLVVSLLPTWHNLESSRNMVLLRNCLDQVGRCACWGWGSALDCSLI